MAGTPKKLITGGTLHMELDEGEDAYRVADSAYDEMLSRGIKLPERPKPRRSQFLDEDGSPLIPPNLQELSDLQLGELYGILDDYYAYVSGQLADIQNQYEEAKEVYDLVSAVVRLAKEGKQKDKDDKKKTDRRYVLANARRIELKCLYNLLMRVVSAQEAKLKLVSRNITLRENATKTGARRAAVEARRQLGGSLPSRTGERPSVRPTRSRPAGKQPKKKPPRRPPPRGRRR